MKIEKIILLISLTFLISCFTGCSTKSWYESGQIAAKQNCNNQPPNEINQCLENLNKKTYKEYKKY